MNLDDGASVLLASVAAVARRASAGCIPGGKHYINHQSWSPDGRRLLFYFRGRSGTRVFTIAADGTDLRLLSAGAASHWTWRDAQSVLIWDSDGYRIHRDDGSGGPVQTLWKAPNGHQSYLP